MQRIEIKKFGPIKDVELAINDYLVFIGPQTGGKSTISKSIYFFKSLRDDLMRYIYKEINKQDFYKPLGTYAKFIRHKFLEFWGPTFHLDKIDITYYYSPEIWVKINLEQNGKYVNPNFSFQFKELFKSVISEAENFIRTKKETRYSAGPKAYSSENKQFYERLSQLVNELFGENRELLYIPAGRSLISTLSDHLQSVHPHRMDFLMRSFIERINKTKPLFNKSFDELVSEKMRFTHEIVDFERISYAKELIGKILNGRYQFDKEGEKIYFDAERYTKINYASSGQQEVLWILLSLFLSLLENHETFIVIEEPESHLYPDSQRLVIELITLLQTENKNQVLITTHSPFVLAFVNNLMFAQKVGSESDENIKTKVNPFLWLDSEKVSAYFVNQDNFMNIFDSELQLIDRRIIDQTARMLTEYNDYLFTNEDEEMTENIW